MNGMCPRQRGYWLQHNECPIITDSLSEKALESFYFTGAHPDLSQCVDRARKRFAFIKCSLVKCHINLVWLTEYVMFGFQLVCARTGVGRPPGSFLFWNSPGENPDHQDNTVSHSNPHALEEPDQLWLLWKSLKCGWSVGQDFGSCWTGGNKTRSNNWKDEALMVFICLWKDPVYEGNVVNV